jgi:hypothetical protein
MVDEKFHIILLRVDVCVVHPWVVNISTASTLLQVQKKKKKKKDEEEASPSH